MVTHGAVGAPLTVRDWIRTTTIGWFLGFLVMLVLILAWEPIAGPGQAMVGIGMGGGLGFWQSRRLRGILRDAWPWTLASLAGMGVPFVLWDLSALAGVAPWFSLPLCVMAGGVLVGVLQWMLLRPVSTRAALWIPACTAGWSLPALVLGLADALRETGPPAALLSLGGMFLGGLMLGAVTAKPLVTLLQARH